MRDVKTFVVVGFAVLVSFFLGAINAIVATPEASATLAPIVCAEEDSCTLDYGTGGWSVSDGSTSVQVNLDCSEEDSCTPEYLGTLNRWVFVLDPA